MKISEGSGKKVLVFLGHLDDPLRALPLIRKHCANLPKKNCCIVSMNYSANDLENKAGHRINYFGRFLKKEDYEYMQDYALRVSENWHKILVPEKNVTEFKNVEIMKLSNLDTYTSLCTVIKNLHTVLNAIRETSPNKIIFISEKDKDCLDSISIFVNSKLGIKSRCIMLTNNNPGMIFKNLQKAIKRFVINLMSELVDMTQRIYLKIGKKYKNAVLMDYRFANVIKDIETEYTTISYIVGKGLKLRLNFLKNKKPYLSFLNTKILTHGIKNKRYFREANSRLKDNFDRVESLRYKNHCIYGALKNTFKECIEEKAPFLKANIAMLYNFLGSVRPKIVILRDSIRVWEYVLTSVAKVLNIPSLVIQHGITSIAEVYAKQTADAVAFWGNIYPEWYKKAGTDISKSKVTGCPSHDFIYTGNSGRLKRYENILTDLGADPEKPTLIYLAACIKHHPLYSVYQTPGLSLFLLRNSLGVFKEFREIQFVVKLHPYYDRREYPKFRDAIPKSSNVFLLKNADIPDLFSGAVAVISDMFSTAILDAIILKKPVITYNITGEGTMPIEERKVGIEIRHPEELRPAIKNILIENKKNDLFRNENFESFIKDFTYKIDGHSSERVKNFIRELIPQ